MTKLLEIKDQILRFYGKNETYLYPVVKFLLAFIVFQEINANIGYMERISTWLVALLLSLVCAILPISAIIWISAAVVLLDMYALSLEAALTAFVLFAVIFLVYFRFSPKEGIAAILTPVCFQLKIPYVMPLAGGLLRPAYSVIAVVCGTIIYYFLDGIHQNASALMAVVSEGDAAAGSKFDESIKEKIPEKMT